MRYFKTVNEGYHASGDSWGDPSHWLEVNDRGDAERRIEVYPNGNVLSYDRTHDEDEYSALAIMVVDGDDKWWEPYAITREEFEEQWCIHVPMNRPAPGVKRG